MGSAVTSCPSWKLAFPVWLVGVWCGCSGTARELGVRDEAAQESGSSEREGNAGPRGAEGDGAGLPDVDTDLLGTPPPAEPAGGQTTDFGDGHTAPCAVVRTELVSVARARELGFPIDAELELVQGRFEAPFHRGNFECGGAPSSSGTLVGDSVLTAIQLEHSALVPGAPADVICSDELTLGVEVTVATSDGSVAGRFGATVRREPRLHLVEHVGAGTFTGSLELRVDASRPHQAFVDVDVTYGAAGSAGSLRTRVAYSDGPNGGQDHGAGLFWPLEPPVDCDWLDAEPSAGSRLISLDAYAVSQ